MMRRRFLANRAVVLPGLIVSCLLAAGSADASARLLVIVEAQDAAGIFKDLLLPESERRALVWPEGVLIMPDTLPWLDDGSSGLAFELRESSLTSVGHGGLFRLHPGRYEIDTPLVISDGEFVLSLCGGELEVNDDRIIYYRPRSRGEQVRNRRGEYYIVAGLVLATALLLRAARRRARRT